MQPVFDIFVTVRPVAVGALQGPYSSSNSLLLDISFLATPLAMESGMIEECIAKKKTHLQPL